MCMGCDERDAEHNWRVENRVEDVHLYLIRNTQERAEGGGFLWWTTRKLRAASCSPTETAMIIEHGWSDLSNATVFDSEDGDLPLGGEWVAFRSEVETLNDAVPSSNPDYAGLVNRTFLSLTLNEGKQRESSETHVEQESEPLTVEVTDLRGKLTQYGEPRVQTYLCVSGTDVEGVRKRFAELT